MSALPGRVGIVATLAGLLLLSACENMGLDHVQIARQALGKLCNAPPDGLAELLPGGGERYALTRLCSILGITPRLQ